METEIVKNYTAMAVITAGILGMIVSNNPESFTGPRYAPSVFIALSSTFWPIFWLLAFYHSLFTTPDEE